jgi:hypothetical protein
MEILAIVRLPLERGFTDARSWLLTLRRTRWKALPASMLKAGWHLT